jgi:hypothetical protein
MPPRTIPVILLALLATACAATHAGDASSAGEGFVPLFNGKDLTGWIHGSKSGEGYRVRDGVIFCTATDGGNLFTEKQYADFVLRLEFKLTPGANNGVAIRSPMQGKIAYDGIEIQVLDDTAPKHANLRPTQYCGSIYDVVPARRGYLKPVGEWNEEEITAQGNRITVKLNGATIVDADLGAITDEKVLAKHPGLKRKSGHIGFLGHGAAVEFRNVLLKQL